MTPDTYRKAVNITAIVASAAFAGGGLLILVSYGARWLGTDPLVWRAGFWDEFLNFALTIIPVNVTTLVRAVLSVRLKMFGGTAPDGWFGPRPSDTIFGFALPAMLYLF